MSSPWGLAFLPDRRMLITQKGGTMVIAGADGRRVTAPFSATLPNLVASSQGGLLDVALDPDFDHLCTSVSIGPFQNPATVARAPPWRAANWSTSPSRTPR